MFGSNAWVRVVALSAALVTGFFVAGDASGQLFKRRVVQPVVQNLPVVVNQKQVPVVQVGKQVPGNENQKNNVGKQDGQAGDQGEKQNGQSGDQGEKQNGQVGDQGEKQNGQMGDQGEKQNGQSGDQGDKKGAAQFNRPAPNVNVVRQPMVVNQANAKKNAK